MSFSKFAKAAKVAKAAATVGSKLLFADIDVQRGVLILKAPAIRFAIDRSLRLKKLDNTRVTGVAADGVSLTAADLGELRLRPSELILAESESSIRYDLLLTDDFRRKGHEAAIVGGIATAALGGLAFVCTGGFFGGGTVSKGTMAAATASYSLALLESPSWTGKDLVYQFPPLSTFAPSGSAVVEQVRKVGPMRFPFACRSKVIEVDYTQAGTDRLRGVADLLRAEAREMLEGPESTGED